MGLKEDTDGCQWQCQSKQQKGGGDIEQHPVTAHVERADKHDAILNQAVTLPSQVGRSLAARAQLPSAAPQWEQLELELAQQQQQHPSTLLSQRLEVSRRSLIYAAT
ncbi:unnamed protein product [Pleuronectes platessa]|uniref:Uncharacterized protein n=1 Tax=Pleuronectes platessa TaxID=8262 RepID=A0A9N7YMR3_PLEPL|nr:unnamed protein product [Pleuronectes platessa]